MSLVLYQYWRSSASWRVRWALAHKGIAFDKVAVNLLKSEQRADEHRARNPIGHLPALEVAPGRYLAESVAIIEWLEETHPTPALYPADPWAKARVRQVCELVNAGIQPLQNLVVLDKVSSEAEGKKAWAHEFNLRGLKALEALLREIDAELGEGSFAVGSTLTAADLFVVPQVYSARRFGVDVAPFTRVLRAEASALATPHADGARPEKQPDAPAT
ncbi:MAG: maleylacetoacetate isomerase [Myxococcales bacterium]|nr:maleylacetoacetate isomerase [Myxococcales bacterium]